MTDAARHELSEAEALAQALERDTASPDLPADVLQTAAFLRFTGKDAELGDDAEQRIFAELQNALTQTSQPKRAKAFRGWMWFAPALTLGALSFLLVFRNQSGPSEAQTPLSLPHATTAVLSATPSLASEPTLSEQDALCDVAERQLKQGQPESALRTIADGLVLSATPSKALARLYVLKAQAHERRGETILANDSYYQALQINQQLMQDSLGK